MSNQLPPPTRAKRRKLSVEVYFVLYLTAIILLLGTAPLSKERYDAELEEAIAKLINTDFSVEVEDIGLTVPFIPVGMENDSNGINLILDTVNVIRAHGSFSRVEFRILAIEDTATGRPLPIEKATLVRNGDSSVFFFWNQGEAKQTAIYRISVEAEAQPIIPSSVSSPALRRRIEGIIAKRNAMRDTAIFSVNVLPITSPEYLLAARQTPMLGGNPSPQPGDSFSFTNIQNLARMMSSMGRNVSMIASNQTITSPPNKVWTQRLMISGMDPRQLALTLPPGVHVMGRGNNYIDIAGTAPGKDNSEIKILARPPDGGAAVEAYFTVTTTAPSDPTGLPQTLYQGNTYNADFRSSGIDEGRISVTIIENGRTIADNKGARFNYIPSSADGIVKFLRYMDGKPFGEYSSAIDEYPRVIIGTWREERGDGTVSVTTTILSTYNGMPNAPVLRIDKGNAEDPVKEKSTRDEQTGRIETTWRIRPKNSSQPFDFTVRAWDLRGREYSTTQIHGE